MKYDMLVKHVKHYIKDLHNIFENPKNIKLKLIKHIELIRYWLKDYPQLLKKLKTCLDIRAAIVKFIESHITQKYVN